MASDDPTGATASGGSATLGVLGGILGWGTYVPGWRLALADVAPVAGGGGGKGTRAVASYDEDTTTLAVAAARRALATTTAPAPGSVWFATTAPAYVDKTNATAVHAALDLGRATAAYDVVGAVRSALGALRAGLSSSSPALVVAADVRTGRPGSADEAAGGDGAAALLVAAPGVGEPVAEVLAWASVTEEFLDRWRTPGDVASKRWEERFGEGRYTALGREAVTAALAAAGIDGAAVDHLVVTGLHPKAVAAVAGTVGAPAGALVDGLAGTIGDTGAAQPTLLLAAALERAGPGEHVVVVSLADGADAIVARTTAAIARRQGSGPTVAEHAAEGRPVPYGKALAWRGLLGVEPPRRPEPARTSATAASRSTAWKFGFVASVGPDGSLHLPPRPGDEARRPMADVLGTVATFTVDRLAYSPSPPVVFAVVDFDGGGRLPVELTDVDPDEVAIGTRVAMTFRRLSSADGIHNYFWKATPVAGGAGGGKG